MCEATHLDPGNDAGCRLQRRGRKHDIYVNPSNGRMAPIPRHVEFAYSLCELIRKQLGLVR